MENQHNTILFKEPLLAISFEGALIKLYMRNTLDKWVNLGVASEDTDSANTSRTKMEILSLENTSKQYENANYIISGTMKTLANQVKALSSDIPRVEVWLPDELILCQTLLQKNKLSNIEATEIVAKSCKLEPEDLCLILSPDFRERSQKISAVTFEAISQIEEYLKSYGIIATKFKAINSQPGFMAPPTFYEVPNIKENRTALRNTINKIPEIFATLLALITISTIFYGAGFQTQTSMRTMSGLHEEENFSFKSPVSLELLSETTFPYFAPQLHGTKENIVFRLAGHDIGSQVIAPQLKHESQRDQLVKIKFGSLDTSDDFALLVLSLNYIRTSQSANYDSNVSNLQSDLRKGPEKIQLMVLKPPLAPEKLNKRYKISEMNVILSDEYPAINILNTDDNDFEQQMLARLNYSDRAPKFYKSADGWETKPQNYLNNSKVDNYLNLPARTYEVYSLIFEEAKLKTPDISGQKITKLNINPTRLDQPNLLIDKIFKDGKISDIITEIPTSDPEIEYVILTKKNSFLPGRPEITAKLTLNQPTMSSGAIGFLLFPVKRPDTISLIADSIKSKKRIRAKATIGPRIPSRTFAPAMATLSNRIELDRTNLLGVFGPKSRPYALLMLSNGEMIKISIGDQFFGWRVYGIDEKSIQVQNGTKQEILRIPG